MSKKIKVTPYIESKVIRKGKWYKKDTFCTGGPGGQAQNKRKNGVRLTDLQTGISAESRDATGQDDNCKRAFLKLAERLIEHYRREEFEQIVQGTHDSQLWIRTYKEKGDMVIDSRLPGQQFSYSRTLNGHLDNLIEELRIKHVN